MPVRVLIACDHIDHDGALHGGGRQLIELLRALETRPVEATTCVLRAPSALGRQLQREGLPLRFLGTNRFSPAPLFRFVRLIRQEHIEVLHLTDFAASTWGRLAGWITGTPAILQVITHHSPMQPRGFPRMVELAFRLLAPLTARVLAISESVRRFAVERMGFEDREVEVLHYPLPTHSLQDPSPEGVAAVRNRHGIAPDTPVIGAVTRFHPVKGIAHLVDAFAEVLRAVPDARLVLVGQGPEEPSLRRRCRELGIEARVTFAGFQREIQDYVASFQVSVVPSLEEGFGLVALESLALGVPVVASRVGGLPDIVRDGQTGLLVPPADSSAIAAAVTRLLREPDLRQRMSRAARLDTARFSLDHYADRLTAMYRELAGRRDHSRSSRRRAA